MDLEETLRDLAPRLLRYGLARCGDRELAEEAAQDGLVALARRWRRSGPIEIRSGAGIVNARSRSGRLWIVGMNPRHPVAGSIILVRRGGNR